MVVRLMGAITATDRCLVVSFHTPLSRADCNGVRTPGFRQIRRANEASENWAPTRWIRRWHKRKIDDQWFDQGELKSFEAQRSPPFAVLITLTTLTFGLFAYHGWMSGQKKIPLYALPSH